MGQSAMTLVPSAYQAGPLDLRWVAKEIDRVSEGYGDLLTAALASGDPNQVLVQLGYLSAVTLYHIRKRASRIDARLANAVVQS